MPKFYVTDGDNTFLIDTNTHLQACRKAVRHWNNNKKTLGKFVCFGNNGFDSISDINCLEAKIVQGLDFKHGQSGTII